jgi:hypothetical protein
VDGIECSLIPALWSNFVVDNDCFIDEGESIVEDWTLTEGVVTFSCALVADNGFLSLSCLYQSLQADLANLVIFDELNCLLELFLSLQFNHPIAVLIGKLGDLLDGLLGNSLNLFRWNYEVCLFALFLAAFSLEFWRYFSLQDNHWL